MSAPAAPEASPAERYARGSTTVAFSTGVQVIGTDSPFLIPLMPSFDVRFTISHFVVQPRLGVTPALAFGANGGGGVLIRPGIGLGYMAPLGARTLLTALATYDVYLLAGSGIATALHQFGGELALGYRVGSSALIEGFVSPGGVATAGDLFTTSSTAFTLGVGARIGITF
jgi:hypothetical protein